MIVALALLFAGSAGAQETKTIKGMVRDVTGEPLIGASVIEKGTNNGVITDVDGNFTLTVPADATLSIAYMGYATREIHLAKRKKQGDLRVTLREDSQQLKEVVVTAMGIKKDTKRLGYAVSTIESDEIVKAGATNFASAMYGKAPGIRITQTQGGSAGAVSINVRGLTSITGNNQPLIILDGVPIRNGGTGKSTDFAEFGNDGQIRSNGLVDINPEDIESVSVLKGASATALYGSEAANGAVVITSKRAKSGKLTVDFTAQVTANLPAYLPKVQTVYGPGRYNTEYSDYEKQTGGFYQRTMNGESYRSLYNTTMSFGPKYDGSDVLYWDGKMRPYLPATDNPWKELFRTGWNQTYNLAISQGTETSSNRFSYTFMGETPNSLTGSFTKHNFKLTGSYKPARTLNIEYSLNYIVQDVKDRPQTSLNLYGSFSNMFSSFMDIPYLKQSYVTSLGYRNTYAGGDVINEMYQYSTASGLTPESLQFRDTEHGGLSYYYPGNNNASGVPVQVDPSLGAGPNGETVYHDGVILPGVVASTGEKNTRIIPAGYYYNQTYNWGTQPEQLTYRHSVFDNSYVKLRELTIGYQFPEKLISKLGMTRLSVSVFGRNLFYFYKALKNYDAESSVGTSWASQAVVGGSTTATRNFGVSLRASF